MKALKILLVTIGIALTSLTFQSCSDDGYSLNKFWVDIATIESSSGSAHYFRLDNGDTLWPAAPVDGYTGHNLEDGQRILLNYTILSDSMNNFSHYIKVNSIEVLLTKDIAEDKKEENDEFYGTDPVHIKKMWIGGNYLNIYFGANYGGYEKHFINLIANDEVEDPLYFEFRHNAYNDPASYSSDGLVCFRLPDFDMAGQSTVTFTIAVKTFDGNKTYTIEYTTSGGMSLTSDQVSDSLDKLY